MKNYLKKFLWVAPYIALAVIGVWYASQLLSNAIVAEFVSPFLK